MVFGVKVYCVIISLTIENSYETASVSRTVAMSLVVKNAIGLFDLVLYKHFILREMLGSSNGRASGSLPEGCRFNPCLSNNKKLLYSSVGRAAGS